MGAIELSPYIFFQGNCREAMEFYKNIFGGELELSDYSEMPKGTMPDAEDMKGKIMNSSLKGGAIEIRGSDTKKASAEAKKVTLCLTGADEPKLRQIFESLGQGGKVYFPLKKEFWGDIFGSLMDKFGVEWMVNITS